MSFSADVKEELSKINTLNNKEVLRAELLGYILTGNTSNYEDVIEYITENEFNIERIYKILFNLNIEYEPEIRGKLYVAKIKKNEDILELLNITNQDDENTQKAIVRGAFLGAGSMNNPENNYHLEVIFLEKENSVFVLNICKLFEIKMKTIEKEEKTILYIKDGEGISRFLALTGAVKSVLKFEDIRILKEMKNNVNRLVNCETANLNKIVNASVNQINDIKLIKKLNKFEELPDYLKEIANVRLEFPDVSLKELGQKLNPVLGKSGVNHRLKKLQEIAEDLRRGV